MPGKIQVEDGEVTVSDYLLPLFTGLKQQDITLNTTKEVVTFVIKIAKDYAGRTLQERNVLETPEKWSEQDQEWYQNNIEILEPKSLLIYVKAACQLGFEPLKNLICYRLSTIIKTSSVEQMRDLFGLPDDLPADKREQFQKKIDWWQ